MQCRIGTSGWVYAHWRGLFYPQELPTSGWLPYYAGRMNTVELNNSFYRLPGEQAFEAWAAETPETFCFAVKASRYLTHLKKLQDPEEPLQRFLSRARLLGPKLGPLLYQLPPRWKCNLGRLRGFLACLPQNLDHVVEFRDPSWINDEALALLEAYHVGFCITNYPGITCPMRVTASTVYIRMHGAETLEASCYREDELQWWAEQIQSIGEDKQIYVYFNNDGYGYAIQNARRLMALLQLDGSVP